MRSQLEPLQIRITLEATVWLLLMAFLAFGQECFAENSNEVSLNNTKMLLKEFYRETISSSRISPENSVLRKIERVKPRSELLTLYDRKDPSVFILGSFWAQVCQSVDPSICIPGLIRDLKDEDAKVKAFACENLSVLKPQSAVMPLRAALEDHEIVPDYSGNADVSLFAAIALASFGYADGIDLMLDRAERQGEYRYLTYENIFEQLSGQKFPRDLKRWREWFRDHKSRLNYTGYIFRYFH